MPPLAFLGRPAHHSVSSPIGQALRTVLSERTPTHGQDGFRTPPADRPARLPAGMAFCDQCGQRLEDRARFCPNCGAPRSGAATAEPEPPVAPAAEPAPPRWNRPRSLSPSPPEPEPEPEPEPRPAPPPPPAAEPEPEPEPAASRPRSAAQAELVGQLGQLGQTPAVVAAGRHRDRDVRGRVPGRLRARGAARRVADRLPRRRRRLCRGGVPADGPARPRGVRERLAVRRLQEHEPGRARAVRARPHLHRALPRARRS